MGSFTKKKKCKRRLKKTKKTLMKGGVDHSGMIRAVMNAMMQDKYAELLSELTDGDCREKSKQPADSSANDELEAAACPVLAGIQVCPPNKCALARATKCDHIKDVLNGGAATEIVSKNGSGKVKKSFTLKDEKILMIVNANDQKATFFTFLDKIKTFLGWNVDINEAKMLHLYQEIQIQKKVSKFVYGNDEDVNTDTIKPLNDFMSEIKDTLGLLPSPKAGWYAYITDSCGKVALEIDDKSISYVKMLEELRSSYADVLENTGILKVDCKPDNFCIKYKGKRRQEVEHGATMEIKHIDWDPYQCSVIFDKGLQWGWERAGASTAPYTGAGAPTAPYTGFPYDYEDEELVKFLQHSLPIAQTLLAVVWKLQFRPTTKNWFYIDNIDKIPEILKYFKELIDELLEINISDISKEYIGIGTLIRKLESTKIEISKINTDIEIKERSGEKSDKEYIELFKKSIISSLTYLMAIVIFDHNIETNFFISKEVVGSTLFSSGFIRWTVCEGISESRPKIADSEKLAEAVFKVFTDAMYQVNQRT